MFVARCFQLLFGGKLLRLQEIVIASLLSGAGNSCLVTATAKAAERGRINGMT